jgi:hypothetical protein
MPNKEAIPTSMRPDTADTTAPLEDEVVEGFADVDALDPKLELKLGSIPEAIERNVSELLCPVLTTGDVKVGIVPELELVNDGGGVVVTVLTSVDVKVDVTSEPELVSDAELETDTELETDVVSVSATLPSEEH